MQKVVAGAVHDDLLHKVDMLEEHQPRKFPMLPGCDEPWEHEEVASDAKNNPNAWDMEALDQALCEMEIASRKGEVAKTVCWRLIEEM